MNWRPSAGMQTLHARAKMLALCRQFFAERNVLEVTTPALSGSATTEPNIASLTVQTELYPECQLFLHTSPEFGMKRLLAAGSGPIYQIGTVFRDSDFGQQHRPEFSMLEWYRPDWTYQQLMAEVEALLFLLAAPGSLGQTQHLTYRQLFQDTLSLDPFTANSRDCSNCCLEYHIQPPDTMGDELDPWLDLILSLLVAPKLSADRLTFVFDYPKSQAALAQTRLQDGVMIAERFELYWGAMELANGFQELSDAVEQARRFEYENTLRRSKGLPLMPIDNRFLSALESGLPYCAGVALGLDRLLMALSGITDIAQVMTFDD